MLGRIQPVQYKFLAILLPATVTVMIGAFALFAELERKRFEEDLEEKQETLAESYAELAAEPLWNFDHESLERMVAVLASDPDVLAVAVLDEGGNRVVSAGEVRSQSEVVGVASAEIVYRNAYVRQRAGTFQVTFGRERLRGTLNKSLVQDISLMTAVVLVIILGAVFINRRLIGRPLRRLLDTIHASERDRAFPRIAWRSNDELGQIVEAFNSQQERLETQQRLQAVREQHNRRLLAWSKELQRASTHRELVDAAREEVQRRFGLRAAWLYLIDEVEGEPRLEVLEVSGVPSGPRVQSFAAKRVQSSPLLHEALRSGKPIVVIDAMTDPRTNKRFVEKLGMRTFVEFPLRFIDQRAGLFGTGVFSGETPRELEPEDLDYLEAMAGHVAIAANRIRYSDQREAAERDQRRLQAQVLQAQKLESLGLLAGGIAHDFNNLMAAVLGNASLARTELDDGSSGQPLLESIELAAQRAADLAQQMLAYSGRSKLVTQSFELESLVREMAGLVEASISKKIDLVIESACDDTAVEGDPTQIRQVVMNLLTNSADAIGDESGTLRVELSKEMLEAGSSGILGADLTAGPHVRLVVEDTGCGMDAETRQRIFDPFFTTKRDGRGLGMAVVLGIVRSHQGAVRLRSEPGKGTSFTVWLPASGRPTAPERSPSPAAELTGEVHGTVLVVDDEAILRRLLQRILEASGFEVVTAVDGEEALSIYRSQPDTFCAVILDLTMPRMDGHEAYLALRELRPELPILLSSGRRPEGSNESIPADPHLGFIPKPYRAAELTAKLLELLLQRESPP